MINKAWQHPPPTEHIAQNQENISAFVAAALTPLIGNGWNQCSDAGFILHALYALPNGRTSTEMVSVAGPRAGTFRIPDEAKEMYEKGFEDHLKAWRTFTSATGLLSDHASNEHTPPANVVTPEPSTSTSVPASPMAHSTSVPSAITVDCANIPPAPSMTNDIPPALSTTNDLPSAPSTTNDVPPALSTINIQDDIELIIMDVDSPSRPESIKEPMDHDVEMSGAVRDTRLSGADRDGEVMDVDHNDTVEAVVTGDKESTSASDSAETINDPPCHMCSQYGQRCVKQAQGKRCISKMDT
uniref:Uncharacterized protein n=1 Tax=Moniliophthora roreri TaxID=221103 RepID=A0A0W0FD94_MONRR